MNYTELKALLNSYEPALITEDDGTKFVGFYIDSVHNSNLKKRLKDDGYWRFSPEASTSLVLYHYIIAFYSLGKKLPSGEGDKLECYHLDGDTMNNHPDNLVYMTYEDYYIAVTKALDEPLPTLEDLKKIGKRIKSQDKTAYDRSGRKIKCWATFILNVIREIVRRDPILTELHSPPSTTSHPKQVPISTTIHTTHPL